MPLENYAANEKLKQLKIENKKQKTHMQMKWNT